LAAVYKYIIGMLEPTTGIEPVNLFLTKEALYRLSYVGTKYFYYEPLAEIIPIDRAVLNNVP
jgi:hypothetical protein